MAQPVVSPSMVGRRVELDALGAALDDARAGEGVTVLLGGEAGVGKTRLATEFAAAEAGRSGTRTLVGQCVELGQDGLPYPPIAGILRSMVKELGEDEVLEFAGTPARCWPASCRSWVRGCRRTTRDAAGCSTASPICSSESRSGNCSSWWSRTCTGRTARPGTSSGSPSARCPAPGSCSYSPTVRTRYRGPTRFGPSSPSSTG